ncbi:MAG: Na+:solute symporter [Cyclobacteriaceae bacterium]|nr:Na+:solute symporter [Cyclobacteriaceae bacterium]MCB0500275.1 Na+:solute symporter [Cyclobacteriaceae bacterium]MCB9237340.1 Na+:solute symporter [Flammeovirgaceae bacterium]MCO5271050.1 Na+:solute symporter [Cyclobacteriaceae bacterium]MCW5903427.1 Na+:solute symporter [Cyclobacteriaceae bacterium]
MVLSTIDWTIVIAFLSLSLIIGLLNLKKAGQSANEFFLSSRSMPWWLLGISMVATTFSADTPNLVTDIVRKHGVSGNWVWWAFLLTGMLTVFTYAKLWRRSGVVTDLEFYELRYGGKSAAFLRGFRALYLGVFFNIVIMASVSLAAIKIGGVMMGLTPVQTLSIATIITVAYSSLGGLRSVLITDFFQFVIAMIGSVAATIYIINQPMVGGLNNLFAHTEVVSRLSFLPDFSDSSTLVPLLILPLAVQWWSVWYPGSEPGGGGYIAQRMLSAKDEKNALTASLVFNITHYALRPWPWILIALASLLVFPDLTSLQNAFPHIPADKINDDLAYPAMLTFLPAGLMGVLIASLVAAYMSTISTHLNWGSSYVVNDFYRRFVKPNAPEKELVLVGRLSTVVLAVFSALLALGLSNALQAFNILLQIGAGTGLIFILRWFWWRINTYTEISGMTVSFLVAIYFEVFHNRFFDPIEGHWKLLIGVGITTACWLLATLLTQPESNSVLARFYEKVRPSSIGWQPVVKANPALPEEKGQLPFEVFLMVTGSFTVYGALFCIGFWLYGNLVPALVAGLVALAGTVILIRSWGKLKFF